MKAAETRIRLLGAGCRWLGPSGLRFIDLTGRQWRRGVRHLEISPSPFKWEVSGRALRTLRVGEQSRESPGPAETEQGCALRLRHLYAPPTQAATPRIPPPLPSAARTEPLRSLCARTEPPSRNTARCRECGEEPPPGRKSASTEVFALVSLVSEDLTKCEHAV